MDMKVDGGLVKQLRHRRNWSQDQLAGVSGISLRTIQRIENDGACSLDSRAALASAFDVHITELEFSDGVRSVGQEFEGFICAFNSFDYDAFISFFTTDATIFNALAAKTNNVVGAFQELFAKANSNEISPDALKIIPQEISIQLHGDVALLTFCFQSFTGFNPRTLFYIRSNGVWKVKHLHGSFVLQLGKAQESAVAEFVPSLIKSFL